VTGQIVAFRSPRIADAHEAWIAAVADLHTLITLDPTLGVSPVRIYFVLNPQALSAITACVGPDDRPQARLASAFALVAYDFPFALHLIECTAPRMCRERGKQIATRSAGLQGDALRAAASAFGIEAHPLSAFDEGGLKTTFFPDTQETVTHLFRLVLRDDR
jgi:3-hydroxypropanoate dehydrogenase